MTTAASFLLPLFAGLAGNTPSLVATAYGRNSGASRSGLTPFQALAVAEKNQTRDVARTAAQPDVKRAIDAFKAGIAKAGSVDALLRDPAVMRVLLTANGLGDQIGRDALARRALTSDLTDPKSLANTLTDRRWKQVAATYEFATKGLAVLRDPAVQARIASGYAEVKWRQSLDAANPGLSNALTFRARAASVTSVYEILGDPVLRDVVTVALRIPKQIAFQTLTAQESAISTRLDLTRLKDTKFVEAFAQRYLHEAAQAAPADTVADITSLAIKASGLVV